MARKTGAAAPTGRPLTAAAPPSGTDDHSADEPTAATPRRIPAEILETIDNGDGRLVTRYRWHVEGGTHADGSPMAPSEGEAWASGPVTPLSRAILEDRWSGLLLRQDATKLQIQLDKVLRRLAEDLTRRDVYSESAVIEGEVVSLDSVLDIDGLQLVIRDWMLERAAKVAVR